ncbi:proton-conducting transporter membrane subunit [Microbacterium sp. BG28]|uniref:proton-conducting transporter transmembrane domain-containing protein n=1 Tax=Microbacterium sp. BG28 TaxID=3097356 RepID=UPI002A5A7DE7|nr:proton-conducting transporter membrane subunit [Microbacterium sp. BG28]MDY0829836.1 proton-conducting transporter membrane subunit [Microbacterium sp. BG28]
MSPLASLTTAALVAAAAVAFLPASPRRTPGSLTPWAVALAAVAAAIVTIDAIVGRRDGAGAALMLLVTTLTAVVQLYAARNLRGDPRARAFFALSALAAAGTVASIAAQDALLMAAGWTLATFSTIALIRTGGAHPQARLAARRTAWALLVGDGALWAAVGLTIAMTGSTAFSALGELTGAAAAAVSILVAAAAIARAGSFPFHGWLPATAATSTPVSALLHAGFVNGGALLLLRFAPVASSAGPWVLGVAGGATMLVATVAMLTRPDVKGRLVQSTAAQMGFMLVACAMGAFGVAVFHVMGHALFKASLFLGAGSALERELAQRTVAPPQRSRSGAVAGAVVVLAAAAGTAVATGALDHPASVLLLFVVATAVVAGAAVGAGAAAAGVRAAWIAAVALAAVGYVAIVFPAAETLAPEATGDTLPIAFAAVLFASACILGVIARGTGPVADRVFAFAFSWGRPPLPTRRTAASTSAPFGPLEYGRL